LDISKDEHGEGPMFMNNAEMELPVEEVAPISQNIKSFQKISIRFALYKGNKLERQVNRFYLQEKIIMSFELWSQDPSVYLGIKPSLLDAVLNTYIGLKEF
jgi:hypothetical protein